VGEERRHEGAGVEGASGGDLDMKKYGILYIKTLPTTGSCVLIIKNC
jgi:hypothetical protein